MHKVMVSRETLALLLLSVLKNPPTHPLPPESYDLLLKQLTPPTFIIGFIKITLFQNSVNYQDGYEKGLLIKIFSFKLMFYNTTNVYYYLGNKISVQAIKRCCEIRVKIKTR